jgi:NADH:ubiquinone oxidoreductase subunit 2 (subunit N)
VSLFYYVKVLKVMVLDRPLEAVENRPVPTLPTPWLPSAYVAILAAIVLALGIFWDTLSQAASDGGVNGFAPTPSPVQTAEKGGAL